MRKYLAVFMAMVLSVFVCYEADRYVHPPPSRAASQFANIICDGFTPVSTAANVQVIAAGNANMFIYICSYNLNASAALTFSIVEGTGAVCATGTKAMVGTTTAVGGPSLGIAGTVNYGGGAGAVTKTTVAGNNVCIFPSAGTLAGVVGWTQASS